MPPTPSGIARRCCAALALALIASPSPAALIAVPNVRNARSCTPHGLGETALRAFAHATRDRRHLRARRPTARGGARLAV